MISSTTTKGRHHEAIHPNARGLRSQVQTDPFLRLTHGSQRLLGEAGTAGASGPGGTGLGAIAPGSGLD